MWTNKQIFLALIVVLLAILSGCAPSSSSSPPEVNNGILDLTSWDRNKHSTIQLNGEWEFYWSKFLYLHDLQKEKMDLYAEVPNTWNEYLLDGKALPGQGYATYRLHVKTDLPKQTILGLDIKTFSSSYRLYVDDKLVAFNGKAASNAKEEVGKYRPQAVFFDTPAKEFDLIIQVSNFEYAKGGFWYNMAIGSADNILTLHDKNLRNDIFLIGALVMISIFYMVIYILIRELRYAMAFSLFCFFLAMAFDMVGQSSLTSSFPKLSLQLTIFIWYTSITWALFFLVYYVHLLFKTKISGIILKLYLGISLVNQALQTFTPPAFYTGFGDENNYIEIAVALCIIIIVAVGIKKGYKDGWLNIISLVILVAAYIHDVFYITNRTGFPEPIINIGLFIFIIIQLVIQAIRIKQFHEEKTAAELAFLQAQIKPHFFYNILNTFASISRYDVDKARELLYNFTDYLRKSFDIKGLNQLVSLEDEIELVKSYLKVEKVLFDDRLEVCFESTEELKTKVPALILQPLIENAVKHGIWPQPVGGRIDVIIKREGNKLTFLIKDNGVGMDRKKLQEVLNNETKQGVGFANINNRLKKLYGKGLQVKSQPDIGTEISWYIPIKRRIFLYDFMNSTKK